MRDWGLVPLKEKLEYVKKAINGEYLVVSLRVFVYKFWVMCVEIYQPTKTMIDLTVNGSNPELSTSRIPHYVDYCINQGNKKLASDKMSSFIFINKTLKKKCSLQIHIQIKRQETLHLKRRHVIDVSG